MLNSVVSESTEARVDSPIINLATKSRGFRLSLPVWVPNEIMHILIGCTVILDLDLKYQLLMCSHFRVRSTHGTNTGVGT